MAKWGELKCPNCAILEAKLRRSALQELSALGQASEAYQAQLAAEAKLSKCEALLAKAVKALDLIAKPKVGPDFDWTEEEADRWRAVWYRKYQDIARAALAELKGQNDEWKCPINYTGCTKNCGSYGCGN